MNSVDTHVQAEEFKAEANKHFADQNYSCAIELYTRAIQLCSDNAIFFGNRSICHLRVENYGLALEDANKALSLDRNYIKGYYRRAGAHMAMGKWKMALKDYETVKQARPRSADALQKFTECRKIVRRLAFERAIAGEDEKAVSETIDLSQMVVEADYSGPSLTDDGEVTTEFMRQLLAWFKDQKILHKKYAFKILLEVKKYLVKQPSLVDIQIADGGKFTVCGDIHGQFYDLLNVFELNGIPSETNPYLFNGDFVDRGSFSVECILTLFGFKLLFPDHFFMSRGNHESETMNQMYGFDGEVRAKYSSTMSDLFTEVYNCLPLCHVIDGRVFVTHGGLPAEEGIKLDDIRAVPRFRQPPEEGIMCDLLWSDPQAEPGRGSSKRGVGCQFGPDVTHQFLSNNGLDYIIRSHEVKSDGYEVAHNGKCITVFSAPNYCDTMGNKGAFITLKAGDLSPQFTTYDAVPHPNVQPMAYVNSLMSMFQ